MARILARIEYSNGVTNTFGSESKETAMKKFAEDVNRLFPYRVSHPVNLFILEPSYKKLASFRLLK